MYLVLKFLLFFRCYSLDHYYELKKNYTICSTDNCVLPGNVCNQLTIQKENILEINKSFDLKRKLYFQI